MLTEKFFDVLNHEGVVAIVSWTEAGPHVSNTWNSYLTVTEDGKILVPVAGMTHLEEDLAANAALLVTLGSREVEGRNGYQGTGFRLTASGTLADSGTAFEQMKERYPFIRKVLILTVQSCEQLL